MSLVADVSPLCPKVSSVRHDWTREEVRGLFALPFPELMFRAQSVHGLQFHCDRGADLDIIVDQDRRLFGGLRLLSAKCALRYRGTRGKADGP